MTDIERNILGNQAIIMSGIDVIISTNNDVPPSIKGMLHKSFDEAITMILEKINQKDSPE